MLILIFKSGEADQQVKLAKSCSFKNYKNIKLATVVFLNISVNFLSKFTNTYIFLFNHLIVTNDHINNCTQDKYLPSSK